MEGFDQRGNPTPTAEAIRAQLARVLASRSFANAPSLRRFLEYVVERTIDGRGEELKEYSIGVDVFDRGDSFDPKTDTIVRVQARRLRSKLREYYESEGRDADIVIAIDKGRYAPDFTPREPASEPMGAAIGGARRSWFAVAAVVVIVSALSLAWTRWRRLEPVPPFHFQSIAVLPLVDLSPDRKEDFAADAITEALITDLGKITSLRVISHTSMNRYKGTALSIPQIAKELDVDVVVEGTITRSGDRARVTANLIRVSPEMHLWAQSYERGLRDILAMQNDVAENIAREVQARSAVAAAVAPAAPVNPEAYQEFLLGRHLFERFTRASEAAAIEHLNRAIAMDPDLALAYATLAEAYIPEVSWGVVPPTETLAKAEAAARKALSLDDTLAEAHVGLGGVHVMRTEFAEAEREFKRAIAINPSNYIAQDWYGYLFEARGDFQHELAQMKLAKSLNPVSELPHKSLATTYLFMRDYDRALEEAKTALEINPDFEAARVVVAEAYRGQGRYRESLAEFEKIGAKSAVGYLNAVSGNPERARAILAELEQSRRGSWRARFALAIVHIGLGETDAAIAELEAADRAGVPFEHVNVVTYFDPLRHDRRFIELMRRHGFGS